MSSSYSSRARIELGREAGLLLSAQGGDLDSFVELFRDYHLPLYRLCFALSCDAGQAAQLTAQTARIAWRMIAGLRIGQPFFPFAARIARNLALAHERDRSDTTRKIPDRRPSGVPWGGDTGNPVLAAEEQRLFVAFDALTVDERVLVALRWLEDLTCSQIATVLGVPAGSVVHRLQSLRARFDAASRAEAA